MEPNKKKTWRLTMMKNKFKNIVVTIVFIFTFFCVSCVFGAAGRDWTQVTGAAAWPARSWYSAVVFNNKIWVMGGASNSGFRNDVWYSADGINWTQATGAAAWPARVFHAAVVFDNKMWVMGGYNNSGYRNDAWYSTDGINWTQATGAAAWPVRCAPVGVVFDKKMWIMGGWSGTQKNDVWSSSSDI